MSNEWWLIIRSENKKEEEDEATYLYKVQNA